MDLTNRNRTTGGVVLEVFDSCYINLGEFSFKRKWMDKDVSESLTAVVAFGIASIGMLVGFLCGWSTANSHYNFLF